MKFRKGTKVEVLQKGGAPLGSWRPAEIVSGNGHTYLVSYGSCPTQGSVAAERVPRKAMRPLRPPLDGIVCWVKGEIAEAFDSYAWKVAEVVRLLGFSYYLVRLLGSSLELKVHASNLRIRQLWEDGKWVAIPKDSARFPGDSPRSQLRCGKVGHELVHTSRDNCLLLKKKKVYEGNTSQGLKRKSSALSAFPMQYSEVSKRFQTSHRDGSCNPCGSSYGSTHPQEYDCADICSRTDDAEASVSERESFSRTDDAEASVSGRESPAPVNDGLKEKTHLLELHAYRATLMALYASGSISWEQEAMMTNLRLTLNISTDEHLSELRSLGRSWRLVKHPSSVKVRHISNLMVFGDWH
uniref:ENT domain-containing protein n=1 Tax=Oryza glumipatula TaxID=40148 RepID=A0A0D9YP03_9ORYZ